MYYLCLIPLVFLAIRTLINVYSSTLLDFSMYLTATNYFLAGGNPYLAVTPQVYPPAFLFVMTPFALLPIEIARILWTTLSLISFFVALHLLLKHLSLKTQIFLGLFTLQLFPVKFALAQGQINFFVFLGFVLLYRFSIQKKDFLAGFIFALITIMKLNPILLILYFLVLKKYRLLLYSLGILLLLNLGLDLLTPIPLTTSFIQATFSRITTPPLYYYNQSLPALLSRLNLASLSNFFGLFFLSLTTYFFAKNPKQTEKYFSLFLVTILLVSPITWQHYLFWTLPAFIYLFPSPRSLLVGTRLRLSAPGGRRLLIGISFILININLRNPQVIYSHATLGLLLLYFLVLRSHPK